MDPNNLKFMDVVTAISPTIGLVAGMVFISNGYTVIGSLILIPIICLFAFSFFKLPFKEIAENLAQRDEKKKKALIGRVQSVFEKIFDYMGALYLILILGFFVWYYIK